MTHGDRIRQMTDEELAKFLAAYACCIHFGVDCCNDNGDKYPFCKAVKGDHCYGLQKADNITVKNRLEFIRQEVK